MTEEQFNRIINAMPNKINENQIIAIFATIIEGYQMEEKWPEIMIGITKSIGYTEETMH